MYRRKECSIGENNGYVLYAPNEILVGSKWSEKNKNDILNFYEAKYI